ncbi:hypothetical protein NEOKW01_2043 [Nematocida sp. AWRm80]|nr:hypothetical protein NEOKW01_2043 [Nematocida sp. AWRm80]
MEYYNRIESLNDYSGEIEEYQEYFRRVSRGIYLNEYSKEELIDRILSVIIQPNRSKYIIESGIICIYTLDTEYLIDPVTISNLIEIEGILDTYSKCTLTRSDTNPNLITKSELESNWKILITTVLSNLIEIPDTFIELLIILSNRFLTINEYLFNYLNTTLIDPSEYNSNTLTDSTDTLTNDIYITRVYKSIRILLVYIEIESITGIIEYLNRIIVFIGSKDIIVSRLAAILIDKYNRIVNNTKVIEYSRSLKEDINNLLIGIYIISNPIEKENIKKIIRTGIFSNLNVLLNLSPKDTYYISNRTINTIITDSIPIYLFNKSRIALDIEIPNDTDISHLWNSNISHRGCIEEC